jgi:hypothetical protein
MSGVNNSSTTGSDEEVILLIEAALAALQRRPIRRIRVVQHLQSALKCMRDARESLHPSELNSTNDG